MKRIDLSKIDWDTINKEHQEGLHWYKIPSRFGFSLTTLKRAKEQGLIKKIRQKVKFSDDTRRRMSLIRKNFCLNNPDKHNWKNNKKLISKPCETLKGKLKEENINFIAEYQPLTNRFFSIDIAFPDKKVGLEVNGNQHYNTDLSLKYYYQKRKDDIEKEGWKLFDIHFSKVYDNNFVNSLILNLKNNYDLSENIDYSFYIKKKQSEKRIYTYKKRNIYNKKIKDKNKKKNEIIQLISNSNIDFTKLGWATKLSKILKIKHQKVSAYMKKYMPKFYEEKCYKKTNRNGLSRKRKYGIRAEYLTHIGEIGLQMTMDRIRLMKDNGINISQKGYNEKLRQLFGLSKSGVCNWVSRYRCFIIQGLQ